MHIIRPKILLLQFLLVIAVLSIVAQRTLYTNADNLKPEDVCSYSEDLAKKGTIALLSLKSFHFTWYANPCAL